MTGIIESLWDEKYNNFRLWILSFCGESGEHQQFHISCSHHCKQKQQMFRQGEHKRDNHVVTIHRQPINDLILRF